MSFQTAVRTVLLEKYATFSGRARRSEFWWFFLFNIIVSAILNIIDRAIFGTSMTIGVTNSVFGVLYSLAVLLPFIAVGARRLHDTGRSAWWLLIAFIPLIGGLILIYWYIQPSQDGSNEYGPNPIADD
ncbi:MAG: DUF805 domain-containing protein [Roseicyclus sp.]|nr:DUF805 domain-containing protein [Roseicyclus sp.]MBO6625256.1 DUF805 domain-containing protein [Roseicyclus sp.]MBO6922533.1 DUF805 domain-containing protein [Roseicyclus sp.]